MPYEINPEPGENVLLDVWFQPSNKCEPFGFAVSDQALYVPAKKFVISGDPRFFKRVPDCDLRSISVEKTRPYAAWMLSALMTVAGLTIIGGLIIGSRVTTDPHAFCEALSVLVGGLLVPFAAKGRKRLVITMASGTYKWNPPFVVDKASKQQIESVLQSILEACRRSGKPVVIEPPRPTAMPILNEPLKAQEKSGKPPWYGY